MFNYSDSLDRIIKYKFKSVRQKILRREFPFISEKIADYYHVYEKIIEQEEQEDV